MLAGCATGGNPETRVEAAEAPEKPTVLCRLEYLMFAYSGGTVEAPYGSHVYVWRADAFRCMRCYYLGTGFERAHRCQTMPTDYPRQVEDHFLLQAVFHVYVMNVTNREAVYRDEVEP